MAGGVLRAAGRRAASCGRFDNGGHRAVHELSGRPGYSLADLADDAIGTTAFDVSETAVRVARDRFPGTKVQYQAADLLDPPPQWSQAFDLGVEVITVQALPVSLRATAIANIADLVAPGGTLFVVAAIHDDATGSPPWPLTRAEVESFGDGGLDVVSLVAAPVPGRPEDLRWQAEFRRPASS